MSDSAQGNRTMPWKSNRGMTSKFPKVYWWALLICLCMLRHQAQCRQSTGNNVLEGVLLRDQSPGRREVEIFFENKSDLEKHIHSDKFRNILSCQSPKQEDQREANCKGSNNIYINEKCFIVKIADCQCVNLTVAKDMCRNMSKKLANINGLTSKVATDLRSKWKSLPSECHGSRRKLSPQVYTGLTYRNKTIYDSRGNAVPFNLNVREQHQNSDIVHAISLVLNADLNDTIRAVGNDTDLHGVICEND